MRGKERDSCWFLSCGSSPAYSCRLPRLVGRPVVCLFARIASPAIEGVIERHARRKLLEIVVVDARESERGREQPGRFRGKIERRRVGASDDCREAVERVASE